jgi:multiple sugar transport system substrate-binding protein
MTLMPNLGTQRRRIWMNSHNLIVFRQRRNSPERTRACLTFFKYLSDHSGQWSRSGVIPVRRSAYSSGEMARYPRIMELYRRLDEMKFSITSQAVEESLGPVVDGLLASLAGRDRPDGMNKAARQSSSLLRQDQD